MQGFTPENLDCITIDEKEMHNLGHVYLLYANYCFHKSLAMTARKDGQIEHALRYENTCDKLYSDLPEWAKW